MRKQEIRPKQILREIGRQWPNTWAQFKSMRADKGISLPDWPDWCYLPIAAGVAVATQGGGINSQSFDTKYGPAVLIAAASWRVSQGVYRFDADLYNELINQPLDGNVPSDVLKRLPEWCVYIETLNAKFCNSPIVGFWAHLENDPSDGRIELRFVMMCEDGNNLPIPVHLGNWSLEEGLLRMQSVASKNIPPDIAPEKFDITSDIVPLLQLVLYLCAENMDIYIKPEHPLSRATKSGRIDAPRKPKDWVIGERIGTIIRKYRNQDVQSAIAINKTSINHSRPRPHVRRAHWHHFWTGPMEGNRDLILRWLPPVPVGLSEYDLPAVIHKVKK